MKKKHKRKSSVKRARPKAKPAVHRSESALKALSREDEVNFFNYIVNNIGDELMLIRGDGRIIYANEATVKGLGYPLNKILNRKIVDFFNKKISLRTWKATHFAELKRKRKPCRFVIERKVKNGELQTIDVTAVYKRFNSHEYIISVARNITEQLSLQHQLEESESKYRILCDEAADAICALDLNGRITYGNKAGERLLKISFKKAKGTHFKKYIEKGSLAKAYKLFALVKAGQDIHGQISLIDTKGRTIPVDLHAIPLYVEKKLACIHIIVRDVRNHKEFSQLQKETEVFEALTNFVNGAAQEIKYPLKGVLDRLNKIMNEYKSRDFEYISFKEFKYIMGTIESVGDHVKYCYDTTNRLINLNRKKVGGLKGHTDVNRIIKKSTKLIDSQIMQSDIRFKLRLSPKLPSVSISEVDLTQIMVGLITNGIQSMTAGGTISITTAHHKSTGRVCISIKDQGIGIRKENLSRIFEPFFTTKQRGVDKNSGLGLSIVRSIVRAHHGIINVESSQRRGTLLRLLFPVKKMEEETSLAQNSSRKNRS